MTATTTADLLIVIRLEGDSDRFANIGPMTPGDALRRAVAMRDSGQHGCLYPAYATFAVRPY